MTTWLTQEAYDRLKGEYDTLSGPGRADVVKKIEAAREEGDLKENGGYHAAKEEQGKMEARIRQLTATLENCEIVDTAGSQTVVPGVIVEIRYEGDDGTEKYLIGSIEERHGDVEVMSPGSALGQSIIGASVGDVVDYETPTGASLKVEVVGIDG